MIFIKNIMRFENCDGDKKRSFLKLILFGQAMDCLYVHIRNTLEQSPYRSFDHDELFLQNPKAQEMDFSFWKNKNQELISKGFADALTKLEESEMNMPYGELRDCLGELIKKHFP